MIDNLILAKKTLQKVGEILYKDVSNPDIKKILLKLKSVNTDITNLINNDFSFDRLDNTSERSEKKQNTKNDDFGVDLGGFDDFVEKKDPDQFDWRKTMMEANGGKMMEGVDLTSLGEPNPSVYGRMVDNT